MNPPAESRSEAMRTCLEWHAAAAWAVSTLVILLGAAWGLERLPAKNEKREWLHDGRFGHPSVAAFANSNSDTYLEIACEGYFPDSLRRQTPDQGPYKRAVFFPAYPLAIRAVSKAFGWNEGVAGLVISQFCWLAALLLLARYWRPAAAGEGDPASSPRTSATALWLFACWPPGLFFRTIHTESLFLLFAVCALLALRKLGLGWQAALASALASATRVTGLGVACAVGIECLRTGSLGRRISRSIVWGTLSAAGLLIYMGWLAATIGQPFAFSSEQIHYARRAPVSLAENVWCLLTFRPLWELYLPETEVFWARPAHIEPWMVFSLTAANPVYFLLGVAMLYVGWRRRILSPAETAYCGFVVLVPYVTHADRTGMLAQGRYGSIAFPLAMCAARLLERAPSAVVAAVVAAEAAWLGVVAFLLASGHTVI